MNMNNFLHAIWLAIDIHTHERTHTHAHTHAHTHITNK